MAWLSNWAKRIEITLDKDQIDAALSNFPVPIYLSASSGQSSADVSAIFDELTSDANRKKIAVTTADGETQCYVEIERWDDASEKAWLHVKVPSISASVDGTLFIYYDTTKAHNTTYVGDVGSTPAQNVWDGDFKVVYHLEEDPSGGSGCIKDSTSNTNNGTPGGSMTAGDLVDGQFGKGLNFDGYDDRISMPQLYTSPSELTWELLFKSDVSDTSEQRPLAYNEDDTFFITSINEGTANKIRTYCIGDSGGGWSTETTAYAVTVDRYIVGCAKENNYFDFFVDAIQIGSPIAIGNFTEVATLGRYIGSSRSLGHFADGIISEVRISTVKRTAAWINATYEGLWDNLLTFGVEEEEEAFVYYYLSGYTFEEGNPVSRTLYLHDRADGSLMGTTTSSGNGYYYLETTFSGAHYIVCLDNEEGEDYNDLILGNMIPIAIS